MANRSRLSGRGQRAKASRLEDPRQANKALSLRQRDEFWTVQQLVSELAKCDKLMICHYPRFSPAESCLVRVHNPSMRSRYSGLILGSTWAPPSLFAAARTIVFRVHLFSGPKTTQADPTNLDTNSLRIVSSFQRRL